MSLSDQQPADTGQSQITTTRLGRAASIVGTGAKVGLNYLKYYGQRSITGRESRDDLHRANAEDVYKTFSRLKGGPLKVAQMLSIDQNLLPPAYAAEFSKAQYSAPPLSYPLVARTFRREFGKEPTAMFDTFTREAANGASIGQVHKATLGGQTFAVKVQYPGVAQSLSSDLAMVKPLALQVLGLRERDVALYFKEMEERLLEETDYALELKRSMSLSQASSQIPHVRFPRYYPEFSSSRILTMDWIDGMPLDQFALSNPAPELRNQIGQALWDFYHHQIHSLKLFHADPHPGNFLVKDGDLWVIDFGCTKQLDEEFYRKNFTLLRPELLSDGPALEAALEDLGILLAEDDRSTRELFLGIFIPTMKILAQPFRTETFDFGEEGFMRAIYELSQSNSQSEVLRNMSGTRGSAHSLYVNRTYLGLYSLLARLLADIRPILPDWISASAALAS